MKKNIYLITILFLISCNKQETYINDAIDIMEDNFIRTDSIDWNKLRISSIKKIGDKKSNKELYPIIKSALISLGDSHSLFITPELESKYFSTNNELPKIEFEKINNKISYIKIPTFLVGSDSLSKIFALKILEKIKILDRFVTNYWIIDLTENMGGNMWPMYLGLSPILKTDISGYFLNSKKEYSEWYYRNKAVFNSKEKILEINDSYEIKSSNPKIAVLISKKTASSGEAIAIMFKGFPNTKFFGEKTAGLTTNPSGDKLSDGAMIAVTSAVFVDRAKRIYGKKIEPDYYSKHPKNRAIKWLLKD